MIKFVVLLTALVSDRLHSTDEDRDRGATAVEYGLMVALIAAVIIVAVVALGDSVSDIFRDTGATIDNPPAPAAD